MLDLNLSVVSPDSSIEDVPEHSITSNSSSVDNADCLSSGSQPVAYKFGILKDFDPNEDRSAGFVTKELFPVNGGSQHVFRQFGAPEMRTTIPPAKKSRRGPRSRSSQYRGVTFYRRTGRWESHIWLVQFRFVVFE